MLTSAPNPPGQAPWKQAALIGGIVLVLGLAIISPAIRGLLIFAAIGVGIWAYLRHKQGRDQALYALMAVQSAEIARYHAMKPREFEEAIALLCQRDGCHNVQVVGGTGDLGADVIATARTGAVWSSSASGTGPPRRSAAQTCSGSEAPAGRYTGRSWRPWSPPRCSPARPPSTRPRTASTATTRPGWSAGPPRPARLPGSGETRPPRRTLKAPLPSDHSAPARPSEHGRYRRREHPDGLTAPLRTPPLMAHIPSWPDHCSDEHVLSEGQRALSLSRGL